MEQPFYRTAGFWFNCAAAIAAIGGIFFQHQLSEVRSERAELLVERKQRELEDKQQALDSQKAELDRLVVLRNDLLELNSSLENEAAAKRNAVMAAQRQLEELRPQLNDESKAKLEEAQRQLDSAASSDDDPTIETAVQQLFAESRGTRTTGHATLTRRFFNDTRVIASLHKYFQQHTVKQAHGVINTLYVLAQGFDTNALRAERDRVWYILEEASKLGPQASKEASNISRRITP